MVKIFGHPRSGNNFLMLFLAKAFYPEEVENTRLVRTGHWSRRFNDSVSVSARKLWGGHGLWSGQSGIYLLRDVRDVALSLYRSKRFQHQSWETLSFSEFLQKSLDWYLTPGKKSKPKCNIVEHWKRHLDSWHMREGVLYVRYEELLTKPSAVVDKLEGFIGHPALDVSPLNVKPTGPLPSEDFAAQKWKSVMSKQDLEYILNKVGKDYWGLWQ